MTLNVTVNEERLTLFNVSKYVLGYDRLDNEVHGKWCAEFEQCRMNGMNRFCYLKPRGTYKSTIYNVSTVIDLLIDDYVTNGKFTKTILIASATDTLAANLLSEITEHLKHNTFLHSIFAPNGEQYMDRATQKGIWFKNRVIKKEANIACVGALSSIVSSHYDIVIVDDISNQDDRESITIRERKWRWYIDLISILNPGKQSLLLVIGTRWAKNDALDNIIELNEDLPDEFKYHVEIDGVYDEDGNPKYPSIYPQNEIDRLRIEKGKIEFASQYLNTLLSTETMIFDYNEFKFYRERDNREEFKIDFKKYPHYIYCDPALGGEMDYSVILVGAVVHKKLYIRQAVISNTIKVSVLINHIERLNNEYSCLKCGIESNGFQSLIAEAIKERNVALKNDQKRLMRIEEIKNYKNKEVRIESAEPYVTSGKVVFREDWETAYPLLIEQLVNYPITKHDDAPDALEGLIRITINNKFNTYKSYNAENLKKFTKRIKMRR